MRKEQAIERFGKITQLGEERGKLNNKFLKLLLLVVFLNLFSFASFGVECSLDIPNGILGIFAGEDETVTAEDVDSALQTAINEVCVKAGINPDEDCGWTIDDMKDGVVAVKLTNVRSIGDNIFFDFYSLKEVDFDGTEEQWNKIKIGKGNEYLRKAKVKCKDEDVDNIYINFDIANGELTIYTGEDGTVTAENLESALNKEYAREYKNPDEDREYDIRLKEMRSKVSTVYLYNVRKIGDNAFNKFSNLRTINFDGSIEQWDKIKIGKGNKVLGRVTIYCCDRCIYNMYRIFNRETGILDICAGENGTVTAEDVDSAFRTALDEEYAMLGLKLDEDGQYEYRLAGMRNLVKEVHLKNVRKIGINVFNQFGNLRKVVFKGIGVKWNKIKIGEGNEVLSRVKVRCIDGRIDNIHRNFDETTGELIICAGKDETVTAEDVKNAYKTLFDREYVRTGQHFVDGEYMIRLYNGLENKVFALELSNVRKIDDGACSQLFSLQRVVFHGTKEQWMKMEIGKGNEVLRRVKVKCEDGDIEGIRSNFKPTAGELSISAGEDGTVTAEDIDYALKTAPDEEYARLNIDIARVRYGNKLAKISDKVKKVELKGRVRKIGYDVFNRFANNLQKVDFHGTKAQWRKIEIGEGNAALRGVRVKCEDGDIEGIHRDFDETNGKLSICVGEDGTVTAEDVVYAYKIVFDRECIMAGQYFDQREYVGRLYEGLSNRVKEVELKGRVKKIGDNTFSEFNNLEKVSFDGTQKQWNAIEIGKGNEILKRVEVKGIGCKVITP